MKSRLIGQKTIRILCGYSSIYFETPKFLICVVCRLLSLVPPPFFVHQTGNYLNNSLTCLWYLIYIFSPIKNSYKLG